ncbi:hypothetical protein [Nocardia alni]|uniref:hypothetical protein n=1 Tax=Nocardia alni TaxID=2815723 RepID=UPI001C223EB4|nr:hypothetical protein [Nocardia alni]
MTPAARRHLHLDSGPLHLDYQGPAKQVNEVAADLANVDQINVRVDDDVRPDQISLPCARLWDPCSDTTPPPRCADTPPQIANSTVTDKGATVSTTLVSPKAIAPLLNPDQSIAPDLVRDRLIDDRAKVYLDTFGLCTVRTQNGTALAVPAGQVVGLMTSRTLARKIHAELREQCGPMFTDHRTCIFLTQCPSSDIDIAETTVELYRSYEVMALAYPGLLIRLPTPGSSDRCWIQTPTDDQLPTFAQVVLALAEIAQREERR